MLSKTQELAFPDKFNYSFILGICFAYVPSSNRHLPDHFANCPEITLIILILLFPLITEFCISNLFYHWSSNFWSLNPSIRFWTCAPQYIIYKCYTCLLALIGIIVCDGLALSWVSVCLYGLLWLIGMSGILREVHCGLFALSSCSLFSFATTNC